MEKKAGEEVLMLISRRAGVVPAHRVVALELVVDSAKPMQPLNLVLQKEQAQALIESLQTSLQRLQAIQ